MGRDISQTPVTVVSSSYQPSGVFGTGQVAYFSSSATFTVPAGITSVRARVWGGGGGGAWGANNYGSGGAAGGFSMKVVTGLTPGGTVAVTVSAATAIRPCTTTATQGTTGGTSSFGAYCSATGGTRGNNSAGSAVAGGIGTGGDINFDGGAGNAATLSTAGGGGGAGNYFGVGGTGGQVGHVVLQGIRVKTGADHATVGRHDRTSVAIQALLFTIGLWWLIRTTP